MSERNSWWKPPIVQLADLPAGGFVLAVNRVSGFDHLLVSKALTRPVTTVTAVGDGLWRIPGVATTDFVGEGKNSPQTVFARDEIVLIFPERRCGNDGLLHRGTPDVAALALQHKVPIVPAALVPTESLVADIWFKMPARWAFGDLSYCLIIGEAIDISRYLDLKAAGEAADGFMLRGLTDRVMSQIAQLSGREYADNYSFDEQEIVVPTKLPTDLPGMKEWAKAHREAYRQRRAIQQQRIAAEAELARFLDDQEAAEMAEAQEAARRYAEKLRAQGSADVLDH